jgi:hypothetical protein
MATLRASRASLEQGTKGNLARFGFPSTKKLGIGVHPRRCEFSAAG